VFSLGSLSWFLEKRKRGRSFFPPPLGLGIKPRALCMLGNTQSLYYISSLRGRSWWVYMGFQGCLVEWIPSQVLKGVPRPVLACILSQSPILLIAVRPALSALHRSSGPQVGQAWLLLKQMMAVIIFKVIISTWEGTWGSNRALHKYSWASPESFVFHLWLKLWLKAAAL
jgi:hypothetical protein